MWNLLIGKNGVKNVASKKQAMAFMGSYLCHISQSTYVQLVASVHFDEEVLVKNRKMRIQLFQS